MDRMHKSTFEYQKPTEEQLEVMSWLREAAATYANAILCRVPEGPDRTYALRKLREVAMWVNVASTRFPDGAPRP